MRAGTTYGTLVKIAPKSSPQRKPLSRQRIMVVDGWEELSLTSNSRESLGALQPPHHLVELIERAIPNAERATGTTTVIDFDHQAERVR